MCVSRHDFGVLRVNARVSVSWISESLIKIVPENCVLKARYRETHKSSLIFFFHEFRALTVLVGLKRSQGNPAILLDLLRVHIPK